MGPFVPHQLCLYRRQTRRDPYDRQGVLGTKNLRDGGTLYQHQITVYQYLRHGEIIGRPISHLSSNSGDPQTSLHMLFEAIGPRYYKTTHLLELQRTGAFPCERVAIPDEAN